MDPITLTLCTIVGAAGINCGRDMIHRHFKNTKKRLSDDIDKYLFPEANKYSSPSDSLVPTYEQVYNFAAPQDDNLTLITRLQNCYVYTTLRKLKDATALDRVMIYFPSGDEILTAHEGQSSPKDNKRVILKSPCVERLDKLSVQVQMPIFAICYPGYGPTEKCEVTYEHIREHAFRAVSHVTLNHKRDIHKMIFMGRGVGAALALEVASKANNAPEKIILLSPFTKATDACKTPVGSAVPKVDGPNNLNFMRKVKIPMLLSGDASDDVRLPGHIDKLCDAREEICTISGPYEQSTPSRPLSKRSELPPMPVCHTERHTCPGTESYFSDESTTEGHVADLHAFIHRPVAKASDGNASEPETSE